MITERHENSCSKPHSIIQSNACVKKQNKMRPPLQLHPFTQFINKQSKSQPTKSVARRNLTPPTPVPTLLSFRIFHMHAWFSNKRRVSSYASFFLCTVTARSCYVVKVKAVQSFTITFQRSCEQLTCCRFFRLSCERQ